jgi:hypothetical protein
MSCVKCALRFDNTKQCHEYTDQEILEKFSVRGFKRFVAECPCRTCLVKMICTQENNCDVLENYFRSKLVYDEE